MKSGSRSVALRYEPDLPAPFVSARGAGELAEKLVELANQFDVPVIQADNLAESLFYLEVGQFIPEPFYRIVAELLAFVWQADGSRLEDFEGQGQDGAKTDQSH